MRGNLPASTQLGWAGEFEVLSASFGPDAAPGLGRVGRMVRYLEAGGVDVPEVAGFEAVLAGLRNSTSDDDTLLAAMTPVLNALYQRHSAAKT